MSVTTSSSSSTPSPTTSTGPGSPLNLGIIQPVIDYVNKIVNGISGMKSLLVDQETSGIVGLVVPLSDLLSKEVYYVERFDLDKKTNKGDEKPSSLHHLKAVVFLRPTPHSIDRLKSLIKTNTYKEFHVFFSNIVPDEYLRSLAEGDEAGVVHEVNEYYGDYYAFSPSLFSLNISSSSPLSTPYSYWLGGEKQLFDRNVSGLLSVMLSMKRRPDIRYQEGSECVKMIAHELVRRMKEEGDLFTFNQRDDTPLLLILDRRDDPVTPLLQQWTYRAMVHELVGIHNNRVVFGPSTNEKEVVLSPSQDHFYRGSMYLNFGDLGASIKDLVSEYQRKTKSTTVLETVEDMQRFVDNYPEFRAQSSQVSKHVALVTELARLVDSRHLMSVSEIEQELACSQDHSTAIEKVERLLHDPKVEFEDKLHVVLLYALRYENDRHEIPKLKKILRDASTTPLEQRRINAVDEILKYAGSKVRGGDLFGNKTFISKATSFLSGGLRGVENIYTQHKPLLAETIGNLLTGKLKNSSFPFVEAGNYKAKYKTIIVYMLGGATYEEAHYVHTLNESNSGVRIILGGSTIHNSRSFLDDILGLDADEKAALSSPTRRTSNVSITIGR